MTIVDLLEIEQIEKELVFSEFSPQIGYDISTLILDRVKNNGWKDVAIRISYKGTLVFQYLMNNIKDDKWIIKKENTVLETGHSSLYVKHCNKQQGSYQYLDETDAFVLSGGGYPIVVNGKLSGVISVSGLADYQDHQLIVDAIKQYKGVEKS